MPRRNSYPIWSTFVPKRGGPPIQEQLVRFFRDSIASGAFQPGIRIPATRVLAEELGLARNTVTFAYERLLSEGFLETRTGSGTFVSGKLPRRPSKRSRSVQTSLEAKGSRRAQMIFMKAPLSAPHANLPLTPTLPALDAFPHALWSRLASRFWRRCPLVELANGDPAGYLPLREALASYLGAARSISCSADQIVVTTGAQAAVLIAALSLADPGDEVWVEHPGYEVARRALELAGLDIIGIPVDAEGIVVEHALSIAPNARLAFVTPSHQFPLGVVMSLPRRLSLLRWSAASGSFILEDDYDGEFSYDSVPVMPLKALDKPDGRVVYVGTLSKLLAPGIRLGFLVLPEHLVDVILRVRTTVDRYVSVPLQAITAEFINNGHLGAHIRRLRTIYAERRAALLSAIESEGAGMLTIDGPASGLQLLAKIDPELDDRAIATMARSQKIGVHPLSGYSVDQAAPLSQKGLVIGFANTAPQKMRTAVRILADCVRAEKCAASRRSPRAQ
jgi:GntR family transcriptional regulator / MocR family aminotransferase